MSTSTAPSTAASTATSAATSAATLPPEPASLKQPQDASKKARRLMAQGYVIDSIQRYTGWGSGIRYWTKFKKPDNPDTILPLFKTFFVTQLEISVLEAYKLARRRAYGQRGSALSATRQQINYRQTVSKTPGIPKAAEGNQDELARELETKGYSMIKVCSQQGEKSWCLYETILSLPNDPGSTVTLQLSYLAFKSEAQKAVLEDYRAHRRREMNRKTINAAGKPSVLIGLKRVPDARCSTGYRTVVSTKNKYMPKSKADDTRKLGTTHDGAPGKDCSNTSIQKSVDKQVRDFGVQVEPKDLPPRDKEQVVEEPKRKKRQHKQVREFATQTSHAYFIWDTVY